MVSKFTLFSSLLLASAALAVPSSLVEAPVAHGREDHQPRYIDLVASRAAAAADGKRKQTHSTNWAGAVVHAAHKSTFTYATGIITVPGGGSKTSHTVWLGMGTVNCPDDALSIGVRIKDTHTNGVPIYAVYHAMGSAVSIDDVFLVQPGDQITATIKIISDTEAEVEFFNSRSYAYSNKSVSVPRGKAGCRKDVEWGARGIDLAAFEDFNSAIIVKARALDACGDLYYVSRADTAVNVATIRNVLGSKDKVVITRYTGVTTDEHTISVWHV